MQKQLPKTICDIEGKGTVATAQKRFKYFNEGNLDLKDRPYSRQPIVLDKGGLQASYDVEPSSGTSELTKKLGFNKIMQIHIPSERPQASLKN